MSIARITMKPWDAGIHTATRRFDNTKLVALNTCPTYGIVRYELHKTYKSGSRAMALEAGSAAHEAYAAIRIGDLYLNGPAFYSDIYSADEIRSAAYDRSIDLFGVYRADALIDAITTGEDVERSIMLGALEIFGSSGYYEDPSDRRRTIANIEQALIAYISRYPIGVSMPIVRDGFVGIEIPINMYLGIDTTDGEHYDLQFVGRVDGVHYSDRTRTTIVVEENKTASRLDTSWSAAFVLGHQPTGYILAVGAMLEEEVTRAIIRGMAIPLPKTYDYGGIVNEPVNRTQLQFVEWAEWVIHTLDVTQPYLDKPLNAPKYTHSCNRYFRACPLIPFCDSDYDDRQAMLDDMEIDEWSPLDEGNT